MTQKKIQNYKSSFLLGSPKCFIRNIVSATPCLENRVFVTKKHSVCHNKILFPQGALLSKKYYQEIIAYDIILKQNLDSIMQLPILEKIVLNTTSKTYVQDKKQLIFTLAALELITGQKSKFTLAKKSIANFKIRHHQLLGCRVVLRETLMYLFLEKLAKIIFPRIHEQVKKQLPQLTSTLLPFDLHKNQNSTKMKKTTHSRVTLSVGFQNLMIFPELENHYELVEHFRGMTCTFVIKNSSSHLCSLTLSAFQLPLFNL